MKVSYILTDKEKELLELFREKKELSTCDNYCGWRGTEEFGTFLKYGLIECVNDDNYFLYINYGLTNIGKELLNNLK